MICGVLWLLCVLFSHLSLNQWDDCTQLVSTVFCRLFEDQRTKNDRASLNNSRFIINRLK